ncbi:hypothetical protein WICMUC_004804 [Wickerhamomyces mucosus]|uniref:Autophagy-related protein 16 domain-containing protein n=1 Tax=Wickerhamomyces mucosus TaxID=1378264 RepID=A0A9P8TA04_9ASCO|nr:hypothetical protein WICMUC_004804 [Wickerhamomyces mucosus]
MSEYSWKETIERELKKRDGIEKPQDSVFASFQALYERLNKADQQIDQMKSMDIHSELDKLLKTNEGLQKQLLHETTSNKTSQKEISHLKTQLTHNNKEVSRLNQSISKLMDKLNKQTEEYYHKNKSIELINDEYIAMEIQNNLLFDKVAKLEKENEDLVKRWMEKVKLDADRLNEML